MNHKEATRVQPELKVDSTLASAMLRMAACREKSVLDELLVELTREQTGGAATALVANEPSNNDIANILAISGVPAKKQQHFISGNALRLPLPVVPDEENPSLLLLDIEDVQPPADVLLLIQMYHSIHELMARSTHDRLTRLFNRHSLQDTLQHIYGHAPERRKSCTRKKASQGWVMALLDIDHFKAVNDQFGHLVGDEVLLALSDLMLNSFRQHDRLFRYGGEEFVILMADISLEDAKNVLNRFREQVATHEFPHQRQLTISIGFAAIDMDNPAECVLEQADRALYCAKHDGRNRVEQAAES